MTISFYKFLLPLIIIKLAGLASTPFIGISVDQFGRKTSMLALTLPLLLGWLIISFAYNLWMLYVGRMLTGFATGGFSLLSPTYIKETSSESHRGRLVSIHILAIHLGILYPYVVGSFTSYEWLALSLCAVPVLIALMLLAVPESPRHLLSKRNEKQALSALTWLRRNKSSDEILEELKYIQKNIEEMKEAKSSLSEFIRAPGTLKTTAIILGVMLTQSASGIDVIISYNQKIFKDSGSNISLNLSSIIVGVVQVVGVALSGLIMDRLGRRPLLMISQGLIIVSLFFLGLYFHLQISNPVVNESIGWLPLVSLMVHSIAFAIGVGPIPWIYLEVIPTYMMAIVTALGVGVNWTAIFLFTRFYVQVQENLGSDWSFWIFAILSSIGIIFSYFCIPETKGKTLEELQDIFTTRRT